jgi:glutamine synthetase
MELKQDSFIRGVLGEHVTEKYVEAKKAEWQQYVEQVTAWEIDEYLYKI